jgi:dTMP kinase
LATTRGVFATIEGLDFSGKSTLVRNLKRLSAGERPPVFFTREPGGTPAAERVREVLLDPDLEMHPVTEAYLYAAARADHVRAGILPRLEAGETVICERYLDSSLAYQGSGRELGIDFVRRINSFAVGTLRPDVTFYLRLAPGDRARRARERLDRLENAGEEFMHRVEAGFEALVAAEPERFRALDATRSPDELAEEVYRTILELRESR